LKKIYLGAIFQHWKWPVQGTSTVPTVSAHFGSLYAVHAVAFADQTVWNSLLDVGLLGKSPGQLRARLKTNVCLVLKRISLKGRYAYSRCLPAVAGRPGPDVG